MATVLRCRTSDRTIQGFPAVRAALTVIIPDVDGQDSEPKVHHRHRSLCWLCVYAVGEEKGVWSGIPKTMTRGSCDKLGPEVECLTSETARRAALYSSVT